MDGETVRLIVASAIGGSLALWILLSLVFSVSGDWVRVLDDDARERGTRAEHVALGTFGPFVTGRSEQPGGHHEYTGISVGRTVYLTRRDHGEAMLHAQGYPTPIARTRDGQVAAKLVLRLEEGTSLIGSFTGLRVEFTHQPPRVTGVIPQAPERRAYTRVGEVKDEELDPVETLVEGDSQLTTRSRVS
jgi:hypothetical protein